MSEEGPINVFVVDVQENEYEVDKVVGVSRSTILQNKK